jgi:hypothetical protein
LSSAISRRNSYLNQIHNSLSSYTPGLQDVENGDVVLTMYAYSIQPCYYEEGDEMLLTIHNIVSANAGSDATICENNTHTLDGR